MDQTGFKWGVNFFLEQRISFGGGWRPNPGADENVNAPYDISGRRLK
jgi:hypothetical protein